jgi:hypothetical protein
MQNIPTQHKFKYAHQQILFFKLLFNVKLIYSIQVIGPWLWGNRPFFSSVVGQRKGPSWVNVPPVHGIKNALRDWLITRPKYIPRSKLHACSFLPRYDTYRKFDNHTVSDCTVRARTSQKE